jgi:hypothetical protein
MSKHKHLENEISNLGLPESSYEGEHVLAAAELDAIALEAACRADERRKVLADVIALLRGKRTAGGEMIINGAHAADVVERGDWEGAVDRARAAQPAPKGET